jgi:hypothetical protein
MDCSRCQARVVLTPTYKMTDTASPTTIHKTVEIPTATKMPVAGTKSWQAVVLSASAGTGSTRAPVVPTGAEWAERCVFKRRQSWPNDSPHRSDPGQRLRDRPRQVSQSQSPDSDQAKSATRFRSDGWLVQTTAHHDSGQRPAGLASFPQPVRHDPHFCLDCGSSVQA